MKGVTVGLKLFFHHNNFALLKLAEQFNRYNTKYIAEKVIDPFLVKCNLIPLQLLGKLKITSN